MPALCWAVAAAGPKLERVVPTKGDMIDLVNLAHDRTTTSPRADKQREATCRITLC
jgi:hypothetical protein